MKKKYVPHAWETVNCPFCEANDSKLYDKYGSEYQYTIVRCRSCQLVYQTPRPKYDEQFIHDAYSQYYLFDVDENAPSGWRNEQWSKEIKDILLYDKAATSMLDVGAATGAFLAAAQKKYVHCEGVEVAENMARYAEKTLGIKVHTQAFLDIEFGRKFTAIHMSHVIEHIPNPKDWVGKAKSLLEEDGVLALSVPNVFALTLRLKLFLKKIGLRKGKWKDPSRTPDHLYEPNIPSLKRFFTANGFEILDYYTYSRRDMDARTLFGRIYNRWLKQGTNVRFFLKVKE